MRTAEVVGPDELNRLIREDRFVAAMYLGGGVDDVVGYYQGRALALDRSIQAYQVSTERVQRFRREQEDSDMSIDACYVPINGRWGGRVSARGMPDIIDAVAS